MSAKDSSWRTGLTVLKKSATEITVGFVLFSAIVSIIEGMSKQCQSCGMLNQMRAIVDDALKQNGSARIMRWMAQKQLPRLERWK